MASEFDDILGAKTPSEPPPVQLVTSATDAPTIYADGVLFATRLGSTVRLSFFENILEARDAPSPGLKARHVLNLVLPIEGYTSGITYLEEAEKYIYPPVQDGE